MALKIIWGAFEHTETHARAAVKATLRRAANPYQPKVPALDQALSYVFCHNCAAAFWGKDGQYHCEHCAEQEELDTLLRRQIDQARLEKLRAGEYVEVDR